MAVLRLLLNSSPPPLHINPLQTTWNAIHRDLPSFCHNCSSQARLWPDEYVCDEDGEGQALEK